MTIAVAPDQNELADVNAALWRAIPIEIEERATAAERLELAKSKAKDPSVFDERSAFLWTAQASNDKLDAYFTRMHESSLKQFAEDAEAGVQFLIGHNPTNLGVGRSFEGRYVGSGGDGVKKMFASFYTLSGLALSGVNTSDFVDGVRAGIIQDVSVGFGFKKSRGMIRCSICDMDIRSWTCPHIPGMEYDVKDSSGKVTGKRMAEASIEGASLLEVSAVYDGATPNATITKIERMTSGGTLDDGTIRMLETRYRRDFQRPPVWVSVPATFQTNAASAESQNEERTMEPTTNATPPAIDPAEETRITAVTAIAAEVEAALRSFGVAAEAGVAWFVRRINELSHEAADGRAYRELLLDEALNEGVRLFGSSFQRDNYAGLLATASLEQIRVIRDDWRSQADRQFPAGRGTIEKVAAPVTEVDKGRKALSMAAFK